MSLIQTDAINPQGVLATTAFSADNRLVMTDRPTADNRRVQMSNIAEGTISGVLTITKSGTTARTITVPDAAITVAGSNIDNAWSVSQSFAATLAIKSAVQNSYLDWIAGTTGGTDPRIRGYGSTHATLANRWEYAATSHGWYAADGTTALAALSATEFATAVNVRIQAAASGSVTTPDFISMGTTYASAAGQKTKCKIRLYDDGGGNICGLGLSAGRFEFHTDAGDVYSWYQNNVKSMELSSTALILSNGVVLIGGASASGWTMRHAATDGYTDLVGGTALGTDSAIRLYGSTHATQANKLLALATTHEWSNAAAGVTFAKLVDNSFTLGGSITGSSTTPTFFTAGTSYSSSAGLKARCKFRVYDESNGNVYWFGISAARLEYHAGVVGETTAVHTFYVDDQQVMELSRSGLFLPNGSVYKVNNVQVVGAQGSAVADASAVSGTATSGGYGFADATTFNAFVSGVNAIKDQLNAALARLRTHGLIAT